MNYPTKLTNEEFEVMNKLAKISKMDCWFSITGDDEDVIHDFENDADMDLRDGLMEMTDGLTVQDIETLDTHEIEIYNDCVRKFGLDFNVYNV